MSPNSRPIPFDRLQLGVHSWGVGAWSGAILVALAAFVGQAVPAAAEDYHLDAQDRLTIRIVEWQSVESTFRDWSSISGEYVVGPSGSISLPFVGELNVSGKTTADIAGVIGKGLQDKLGLPDAPEASVEVAQYRPFYISGDVQSPGQFPYVPNLTVLKAVSIAGGMRRGLDGNQRAERDIVTAKGNLDVLADQQARLMVTTARIDAELAGAQTFAAPEGLRNPNLDQIVADEKAIMAARQKRVSLRIAALDDLKELLGSEIESLEKKVVTQRRQVELAKKELAGIDALVQKGLVVNARLLSSERSIAEMEGKLLDFETAILRAKQDISKANQDAIEVTNNTVAELTTEKRQAQADLKEATLKLGMHRALMTEALGVAPTAIATTAAEMTYSYIIVRSVNGEEKEISAGENTQVLPGDVVKVQLVGIPVQ